MLKLLLLLLVLAPVPARPKPDPLGYGYLGVKPAPVNADGTDLTLAEVQPGTPAALAGLRPGDLLVRVGPLRPGRFDEVREYVLGLRPGTKLRVEYVRGKQPLAATVVLGVRPLEAGLPDPLDPQRLLPIPPPNR